MNTPPEWVNLEPERIRILGEFEKLRERALAGLEDCDEGSMRVLATVLTMLTTCTAIVLGCKDATEKKAPWPDFKAKGRDAGKAPPDTH